MTAVDSVIELFQERGSAAYFGEDVSQVEHACQCACLAARSSAAESLIAAALLHDVGHLLHRHGEDVAARGIDARHEISGARWLARWFPLSVTEPIRLHVTAKRYICARDAAYAAALSAASQQSLQLQGGVLPAAEIANFESNPHSLAALALRRWDDEAKIVGLGVPGVDSYRALLAALAGGGPGLSPR